MAVLFLFGAYFPQTKRLSALRERSSLLRQQIADRATRLDAIRSSRSGDTGTDAVAFDVVMPASEQMGEFLETIDGLAEREGLTERNVVPEKAIDGEEVSWLPIRMDFRGSFSSVYRFLERLEKLPRMTRIQELTLEQTSTEGDQLSSSLTMHVYFRRS